ncbi:MAG: exonuclease SbcCD subunit D [Dehalococcoidia bacterium]
MKFIHCADLHIDSPFKGVSDVNPELRELLYQSTYQSFNNIVELAIKEAVDCVLIAGDIYDSANRSVQAQLKFRDGLNRLFDTGIPSFIVHGNHDPLDSWSATLEWPENAFIFPGDRVETKPVTRGGEVIAHISGISFPKRDVYENLALRFQNTEESGPSSAEKNVPHIGLLHANIGSTGHEPYAPCTVNDLVGKGIDYWALGHAHAASKLRESDPAIVYSGCSQSRHPGEVGQKGCYLVTLEPGAEPDIRFVPTDVVRYQFDTVDISDCTSLDDVISSVGTKCEDISGTMDGRHAVVRLSLTGRTNLDPELRKGNTTDEITERIREELEGRDPRIWLEKLILNTAGTYSLQSLRQGDDFVADVVAIYDEIESGEGQLWEELQERMETLFSNWQGQRYLEYPSKEEMLELIREARSATLDEFVEG